MIDRKHIESVLKLNGLESTAHDEEIKSVLLSARFNEDEVDTAIMVLRENKFSHKTKVDGLHKIFRSDESLNSSEISSLLGIDVQLEKKIEAGIKARRLTFISQTLLVIVSIVIALLGITLYMYAFNIGIFHPTSAIAAPHF